MRIVSLLPAATEIVYALGLEAGLVGVTFECDEPPRARREKAVLVDGLDTAGLTPGEIDARVRAAAATGTPTYALDRAALRRSRPDLILTQDLCRVCALPGASVQEALDDLGVRAAVLALDPHTLEDVLSAITAVGGRAGAEQAASGLVAGLRRRIAAVRAAVEGRPRPRVALLEWVDPPFAAGHWVPDLVRAAGGEPVGARAGGRSVPVSWVDVAAARPDVVLVAPCGYGVGPAAEQAAGVLAQLPDVPVWALDSGGLVVRPGPRLVDGIEAIAGVLHEGAVPAPPPGAARRVR